MCTYSKILVNIFGKVRQVLREIQGGMVTLRAQLLRD
jgi:hypothetical protein